MKLQEQVVSLELAKQLKDLGIEQESLFYWVSTEAEREFHLIASLWHMWGVAYDDDDTPRMLEDYSAFTVAELGELLPRCYMSWATPQNGEMKWWCHRMEHHFVTHEETETFTAETEADARAKMLIHITLSNRIGA